MARIETPFSQSNNGRRLNAGKSGLYQKEARVDLFQNPVPHFGDGTVHVTNAIVRVPSARVRVGILIGSHQLANTETTGTLSYAQIYPGLLARGSRLDPSLFGGNQDNDDPLFGQGVLGTPSVVQPTRQGAGYFTGARPSPSVASTVALLGTTGVGSWPVFYEAQSITQLYRCEVGVGGAGGELIPPCPIVLQAVWEIMDPRDGEDCEELLSGCAIDPVAPVIL